MFARGWFSFWDLISVLSDNSWFHLENDDLLLILGRIQRGKCHRRSFWKIPWSSTSHIASAICPLSPIAPHRMDFQYESHLLCALGGMHRTLTMEQVSWSSFDQFWVVFHGELLGDDVISWPCSFRGWNNTFRDLGALGLWTYMIGVAVPKNFYKSCPLKHEDVNLLMSGEMLYHEDPKFFQARRWPVIRYNTIHYLLNIFMIWMSRAFPCSTL